MHILGKPTWVDLKITLLGARATTVYLRPVGAVLGPQGDQGSWKSICHPSPIGQVRLLFPEGLRRLLPQPLCRPEVQGPAVGVRAQLCSGQRVLECPPAPCVFAQAPPHSRFSLCRPWGEGKGGAGLIWSGGGWGRELPPAPFCLSENKGGSQHLLPWMPFFEGVLRPKAEGPVC